MRRQLCQACCRRHNPYPASKHSQLNISYGRGQMTCGQLAVQPPQAASAAQWYEVSLGKAFECGLCSCCKQLAARK